MKKIDLSYYVPHRMEIYLERLIDAKLEEFSAEGYDFDAKTILEIMVEDKIEEECKKYGYKG